MAIPLRLPEISVFPAPVAAVIFQLPEKSPRPVSAMENTTVQLEEVIGLLQVPVVPGNDPPSKLNVPVPALLRMAPLIAVAGGPPVRVIV